MSLMSWCTARASAEPSGAAAAGGIADQLGAKGACGLCSSGLRAIAPVGEKGFLKNVEADDAAGMTTY